MPEPFDEKELERFRDRVANMASNGKILLSKYDMDRCLATIDHGVISDLSRQQIFSEALMLSGGWLETIAMQRDEIDRLKTG